MKLSLSKINFEGEWFDFGDGKLFIRPMPMSRQRIRQDMDLAESLREVFMFCLVKWENFEEGGKPIDLTDAIKEKLYESNHAGIRNFVIAKNTEKLASFVELEKN